MTPRPKRNSSGFTFVELLVALGICAIVMTVAVAAYGSIMRTGNSSIRAEDVDLGSAVYTNLYGGATGSVIAVGRSPNYSSTAQAESMRERLHQDTSTAIGIFCLGRDGRSSSRPSSINFSNDLDGRMMTNPLAFRGLLTNAADFSSNASNAIRGTNLSIFILGASTNAYQLAVRAIYETDMVTTASPAGVYASVRRYEGAILTDYYHVFYADQTNSFSPAAYFYPRGSVNSVTVNRPFYLVWWPDPSVRSLPPAAAGDPGAAAYTNMTGRSSLFFVLPQFPSL